MEKTISYMGEKHTIEIKPEGPTLFPDGQCVAFNGVLVPSVLEVKEEVIEDEIPTDQK